LTGAISGFIIVYTDMFVYKCDKCKKIIADGESKISAGVGYQTWIFCSKCGLTVSKFLKKQKFITNNKVK
jgi:DNA-directed RNA polymerase subunit RPC12/RpoP